MMFPLLANMFLFCILYLEELSLPFLFFLAKKYLTLYSLRPTLFVLFEKSNFLREHHLLSCLLFKNV